MPVRDPENANKPVNITGTIAIPVKIHKTISVILFKKIPNEY
jgi:hypothetical protein